MHLFVNANINLLQQGGAVKPTSSSSVSFDIVRDRTFDRLEEMSLLLKRISEISESKKEEIRKALQMVEKGEGDVRDKLRKLGLTQEELGFDADDAAKLMALALALVAMPNDPLK